MSQRFLSLDEALDRVFSAEENERWERLAPARDLALLLIEYRSEHGLSQRALAQALGVSQPFISKLESGEHLPTIDTLERVAALLDKRLELTILPPGEAHACDGSQVVLRAAPLASSRAA